MYMCSKELRPSENEFSLFFSLCLAVIITYWSMKYKLLANAVFVMVIVHLGVSY